MSSQEIFYLNAEPVFAEALREIYDQGLSWDEHKARAQLIAKVLRESLQESRYADEIEQCSRTIVLWHDRDSDDPKVTRFRSCRRRWCPVCAWRKSQKHWALVSERLPSLINEHGPVRWLLLTLTVRNCSLDELPATVDAMVRGFSRLTNRKTALGRKWPATGWLRTLEITFPCQNEAHPHFHVLLAVRPSYFKVGYVKQSEWVKRWQQAMRLDYEPVVDIRRVKPLSRQSVEQLGTPLAEALGGLREVAKYVLKPSQESSPTALSGLISLKGRHFIQGGGWLRGVLRDDQTDDDEQPDDDDEPGDDDERLGTFCWRPHESLYRLRLVA